MLSWMCELEKGNIRWFWVFYWVNWVVMVLLRRRCCNYGNGVVNRFLWIIFGIWFWDFDEKFMILLSRDYIIWGINLLVKEWFLNLEELMSLVRFNVEK